MLIWKLKEGCNDRANYSSLTGKKVSLQKYYLYHSKTVNDLVNNRKKTADHVRKLFMIKLISILNILMFKDHFLSL